MKKKALAFKLVTEKLNNESFLTYKEISEITGYHPKYLLKLKKDIIEQKFHLEHGNSHRKPINAMNEEEEQKIIDLYKKSSVSVRKFCKFYHSRSYSCIYNVLKKAGLI